MVRSFQVAFFAVGLLAFMSAARSVEPQPNTTGLPTYPHDAGGTMDAGVRSIPNGQHCMHYMSSTGDALKTVEDWYKKALPDAKTDDINHDSMYGGYFKLEGIKLLSGNDLVNIYSDTQRHRTSIELFKCRDAAKAGR